MNITFRIDLRLNPTAYNTDPETGCALPFRVVSFRRSKGANGWNGADDNEVI